MLVWLVVPDLSGWTSSFLDGSYYKYIGNATDWDAARLACQSMNAVLVTITSALEDDFVSRLASTGTLRLPFWIGLQFKYEDRLSLGDDTVWVSNSTSTYRNWGDNEPNDVNQNEDCVEMFIRNRTHKWNDEDCKENRTYVCEIGQHSLVV